MYWENLPQKARKFYMSIGRVRIVSNLMKSNSCENGLWKLFSVRIFTMKSKKCSVWEPLLSKNGLILFCWLKCLEIRHFGTCKPPKISVSYDESIYGKVWQIYLMVAQKSSEFSVGTQPIINIKPRGVKINACNRHTLRSKKIRTPSTSSAATAVAYLLK